MIQSQIGPLRVHAARRHLLLPTRSSACKALSMGGSPLLTRAAATNANACAHAQPAARAPLAPLRPPSERSHFRFCS